LRWTFQPFAFAPKEFLLPFFGSPWVLTETPWLNFPLALYCEGARFGTFTWAF